MKVNITMLRNIDNTSLAFFAFDLQYNKAIDIIDYVGVSERSELAPCNIILRQRSDYL